MYFLIKTFLTALIVVLVSEIAKKYTWAAAIIVSIPLTSLLAFIWLYFDTKDVQKVIDLSFSTIIKQNFTFSLIIAIISTSIAYLLFITIIKKLNFNF